LNYTRVSLFFSKFCLSNEPLWHKPLFIKPLYTKDFSTTLISISDDKKYVNTKLKKSAFVCNDLQIKDKNGVVNGVINILEIPILSAFYALDK